ncbi:MAG: hypothetical protein ACUVTL_10025 [Thermoproteota archaeon]
MGMHSKLVSSAGRRIVEASIDLIKRFTPGRLPEEKKVEKGTPWNYGEVGPEEV